jgi:protein disulfide-isomerase A6
MTSFLYPHRFYAPWCGHCQSLKPGYEKVARKLEGMANIAAVNCEDDDAKELCGKFGIKGFPTLKLVVPSKKPGKPIVEDYNGPRTVKSIVDAVAEKIPNHVTRVTDKNMKDFLKESNDTAKALLFTEKGTTSALTRALAIDFLGSIKFGQVRNKESAAVETFGIDSFPTVVLLPGGEKDPLVYSGEMKKKDIVEFLNQASGSGTKEKKPASKSSKEPKSATSSTSDEASPTTEEGEEATPVDDDAEYIPKGGPKPPNIRLLATSTDIRTTCLGPKSGTCLLALVMVPPNPSIPPPSNVLAALNTLGEIERKHIQRGAKLFPFYTAGDILNDVANLMDKLELKAPNLLDVIVINARRGWWRKYDPGEDGNFELKNLEDWIDSVRMGDAEKFKIPEGVIVEEVEEAEKAPEPEAAEEAKPEPVEEAPAAEESKEPQEPKHEEL